MGPSPFEARFARTSESDSKYVFDISGACESAGKQANAGNQDPCFRAGDGCFEVFGEPTVAAEPGEASLDHPTSRFGLKRPKLWERVTISIVHLPRSASASSSFGP